jgi:hypothetical protein
VFLMSDAFRALDDRQWRRWDWPSTRILYISHDWDSARQGAQALSGRRLVTALLEAGARVHVLAASRADLELRHGNYELTVIPSPAFPDNKIRRAVRMVRSTIPEAAGGWVPNAVNAGAHILSALPAGTLIYSRAMPGASNIVGWHLARLSGLPWVAHFSDEWPSIGPLSNGRGWLAPYKWPLFQIWRRRIIRDAGALTFTNPLQGKDILGGRARHLAKSFVVAHLPSELAAPVRPPAYDEFHIVHTGNIYQGRTASGLMRGLRLFLDRTPDARGRVRFTQAGWDNGDLPEWAARCRLGDVVQCVGRVKQSDVLSLVDSASLLVVVDFALPHSTTLASKMPDYVRAARPILAITAPATSMWRLFNVDGAGLTAHYDAPEEVATQLSAVFDAWRQRRLDLFLPRPAAIESFTPERVLPELAGAFVTAQRARGVATPEIHPGLALTGTRYAP